MFEVPNDPDEDQAEGGQRFGGQMINAGAARYRNEQLGVFAPFGTLKQIRDGTLEP